MWFERISRWRRLRHWNRTILTISNFNDTPMLPIMFQLNQTSVREQICFKYFQDGCHSGHLVYQNGAILVFLNLHAAQMSSIKFSLHPMYCLGADNNWRLLRWPLWRPSRIRFWWRFRKCKKLLTDIPLRSNHSQQTTA